jgi:hypothetical protein
MVHGSSDALPVSGHSPVASTSLSWHRWAKPLRRIRAARRYHLSAPSNKPNESIDDPPVNQWENPVLGEKTLFTDYAIMRITSQ